MTDQAEEAVALAKRIAPLLAGKDPAVQSAVLADLTATWLVGFHPHLRQTAWQEYVTLLGKMMRINELIGFGPDGHPGWKDAKS